MATGNKWRKPSPGNETVVKNKTLNVNSSETGKKAVKSSHVNIEQSEE